MIIILIYIALMFTSLVYTYIMISSTLSTNFLETLSSVISDIMTRVLQTDIGYWRCVETLFELRVLRLLQGPLPACVVLLSLGILMMLQTHVHVMAVTRAVFGDTIQQDNIDTEERELFNPFEHEYGDIIIDWNGEDEQSDTSSNDSDNGSDSDDESDLEDEANEGVMFNDEVAMNGSFLAVLIAVTMLGLEIQNVYGVNKAFTDNVTTA